MKFLKWICFIIPITVQLNVNAQNHQILIDDQFHSFEKNWKEIKLNGAESGKYLVENQALKIANISEKGFYGFYHQKTVTGNFYAEAGFAG
jgi:hypothetical protein